MKFKFKRFLMTALLALGAVTMASCESASHSATVPTEACEVSVIEDSGTHDKYAIVTLGINNNTIYNLVEVHLTYDCYTPSQEDPVLEDLEADVEVAIRHGVAGYLSYKVNIDKTSEINRVKITSAKATKYQTLWQTYIVPFITMIVIAAVSLIFFAFDLFKHGLTKEDVKEALKQRLASSLFIMGLVLIICLIPLLFSSWVISLIIAGGFIGTGLLCGLLTLIRIPFTKE